jgi:DUF3102 family protein
MREKPSTQIGHNSKRRSLDVIGAELGKLRNIFDSGALLVEAKEVCAHGDWLPWLETYFDGSEDTAGRHMAAYRLSLKFRTVRNLKVPVTIIYGLADGEYGEDDDLQAIVKELETASTKHLTVDAANDIIWLVVARRKWGDLPRATLDAIEEVEFKPWAAAAIEELKQARPETDDAADKIVKKHSVDPTPEESAEKDEEEDEPEDEEEEADSETDADHAGPSLQAEKAKIVRAWADASSGAKLEFVRERWDEISIVRKQLDAVQDEDRWLEGDDAR